MSATTSVRIMSGLMMRAQIGVQKSTGKIRGNWGCQKGVFLEGLRRRGKMGQRSGARGWACSEKIFHKGTRSGGAGRIEVQSKQIF